MLFLLRFSPVMAKYPAQFNSLQQKSPSGARFLAVLSLLALALLLAACGRKGPLYLPNPPPETELEEAVPESPES